MERTRATIEFIAAYWHTDWYSGRGFRGLRLLPFCVTQSLAALIIKG